jgi:RNA polymerase sigma-70 factor, ECF subfamily
MMSEQERDLQCILRLQTGDQRALGELYDRYTPLLYPVALRILRSPTDAEDVLQEAWLQVWKNVVTYDPRRGNVAAWLLTVARSRALDRYRSLSSRKRAEKEENVETTQPPPPPDPSALSVHGEMHDRVQHALGSLHPKQREVLEIAYFEGLSQSEIAERVGAPLGTVKSWTRQGLLRLRELLPKEDWAS